jgi:hypothetical protein
LKQLFKSIFHLSLFVLIVQSCNDNNISDPPIINKPDSIDTSIRHIDFYDYYLSSDSLIIDSLFFTWWFRVGQDTNVYFEYRSKIKFHVEESNCNILDKKAKTHIPNHISWLSGYPNINPFYLQSGVHDSIAPGGGYRLQEQRGLPPFYIYLDFYIKGEFVADSTSTNNNGEFEFIFSDSLLIPAYN